LILGAVVANPILAIILYFVLPEPIRFTFAVTAYSAVYVVANLGMLPRLMGKLIGGGAFAILAPTVRPLVVTIISMSGLALVVSYLDQWSLLLLFEVSAGYGIVYVVFVVLFVLSAKERQRAFQLLCRSLKR
jgi:hypothetical protein